MVHQCHGKGGQHENCYHLVKQRDKEAQNRVQLIQEVKRGGNIGASQADRQTNQEEHKTHQ